MYDGGDLYLDVMPSVSVNDTVGVSAAQVGTIQDFEINGNSMSVSVVNEGGTDQNDYDESSGNVDSDDTLIQIMNEQGEYVVVDMYDRDYDDSVDVYYDQDVKASNDALPLNSSRPVVVELDRDSDTILILPKGGDKVVVDWGADYRIDCFDILHPQEEVDATTFIGTSEETTVLESSITEADVGTTKTAGCCSFTVEEFGVAGGAAATVTEITVNQVPGNMVVPEISADTSKNLIIVGGPAVNGMTTVTAEEIAAASQKYIVKKDGRKVIVAGWTAADTVDAGNALVDWLKANVH
jgi:hypothetical protein